ncbi:MAG: UDP-glucose 4-epimerase GalE [Flavobacteriaceae bacterium]|nr:UDP-glucose 4-epimerase GalE [Flavobacteriaceae bacterium]
MKILVTGGLGFIGSHTVVALIEKGYEVLIIDNLSNSSLSVLEGITRITSVTPHFTKLDIRDKIVLREYFEKHNDINGIIHFAASKAVGESVENPLLYYENNINSLVYLMQELKQLEHQNFIFSSSCTVYGQAEKLPVSEDAPVQPAESPYGNTKQIGEEIIRDTTQISPGMKAIALRYFNPIGAHPTTEIGELPIGVPQNLIPFITQTAIGKREKLSVFGNDYPTEDGTCIRDYIHVVDLAEAHVVALERLINSKNKTAFEVFNLGTGQGNSVLEVIQCFEKVTGQELAWEFADRREGDVVAAYAETTKANQDLGWKTKYTLADALKSAWQWELKLKNQNNS